MANLSVSDRRTEQPVITATPASAAQRAYDGVKERIVRGTFRGGALLSEARLGAELGISRTPVHEALMRLSGEGFVSLIPRRGAVVVPVSAREARDVVEMRTAVENAAVEAMRRRGRPEALLSTLKLNLSDQRRLVAAGDAASFLKLDDAFHSVVVEAAGNEIARRFWENLRDRQQRLRYAVLNVQPDLLPLLVGEHENLLAALRAGDPATYAAALERHTRHPSGVL